MKPLILENYPQVCFRPAVDDKGFDIFSAEKGGGYLCHIYPDSKIMGGESYLDEENQSNGGNDMPKVSYVNPKICAHRHVSIMLCKRTTTRGALYIQCDTCSLQSPLVKIGFFRFIAVSRASRAFYKLANFIDKDKK